MSNVLLSIILAATLGTANYPNKYIINTTKDVVLNVPYVNQVTDIPINKRAEIQASACGPASVNMALKYLGTDIDLYSEITKLPTNVYVKGKQFYDLYKAPVVFGYTSAPFENSPQAIYARLKAQEPVLLNVQGYQGYLGHEVVVVGMIGFDGKNAQSLVIHDPWTGPYKEFKYVDADTLIQADSNYHLHIGALEPFTIE